MNEHPTSNQSDPGEPFSGVQTESEGSLLLGVVGGLIAGLLGAAIWAAVVHFTGYEIGWIAWGVGGLVGLGVSFASKGSSNLFGTVAAIITVLSILGGKMASIESIIGSESEAIQSAIDGIDELVVSYEADKIIRELNSRGESVEWPPGVDPDLAAEKADYPPEIWAEATEQWEQLSAEDQQSYREKITEQTRQNIQEYFANLDTTEVFIASFAPIDLLFFGLGIITAFKIASRPREPQPS